MATTKPDESLSTQPEIPVSAPDASGRISRSAQQNGTSVQAIVILEWLVTEFSNVTVPAQVWIAAGGVLATAIAWLMNRKTPAEKAAESGHVDAGVMVLMAVVVVVTMLATLVLFTDRFGS